MTVRVQKSAVNIREKLTELERPIGITGAALMKAETPQEAYNLVGSGRKNIIINGSMVVNQRGWTGAAGTTTSGSYTVDRFSLSHSHDGAVSVGQTTLTSTTGGNAYADGFQTALILRVTTADSSLSASQIQIINQKIEGYNLQGIKKGTANAQPVTLSFWVRSTTTGTYVVALYDQDNTRSVSQAYTINVANTWEKKTLIYPADTTGVFDNDNALSLYVEWGLASGSNYTSGTLNTSWASYVPSNYLVGQTNLLATVGNDFFLTGVQLEEGKVATPFEYRSIGEELGLCQRYYEKSYDIDIAPGSNINTNGRSAVYFSGTSDTAGNMITHVSFNTLKRGTPTITFYRNDGTINVWGYNKSGTSGTVTMVTTQHGNRGFCPYANVGGNNISASFNGSWTASAEL